MASQREVKRYQVKTFEGLKKYIRSGCTDEELAAVLGVPLEGLLKKCTEFRNFNHTEEEVRELIDTQRELGRLELRLAMYEKAVNGDKDMQKFLGKNYLGMKENPDDKSEDTSGGIHFYLPDNNRN